MANNTSITDSKTDIFDLTFEILQQSLSSYRILNDGVATVPEFDYKISVLEDAIGNKVLADLKSSTKKKLDDILIAKKILMSKLKASCDESTPLKESLSTIYSYAKKMCKRHELSLKRRLNSQVDTAERRIRELIFEIFGEYGKSNIRVARRQDYLKFTSRINLTWLIWKHQWNRFALRLCYESTRNLDNISLSSLCDPLNYNILCPCADSEEILSVENIIRSKLGELINQDAKVITIIKFSKPTRSFKSSGHAIVKTLKEPIVASSLIELSLFSNILRQWASKSIKSPGRDESKSPRRDFYDVESNESKDKNKLKDLLRVSFVEWLHPSSYYPYFWDIAVRIKFEDKRKESHEDFDVKSDTLNYTNPSHMKQVDDCIVPFSSQFSSTMASPRVFVCLEERYFADNDEGIYPSNKSKVVDDAMDAMMLLQDYYCRNNSYKDVDSVRNIINSEPLFLKDMIGKHRNSRSSSISVTQIITSFPDVLQVHDRHGNIFHFAPSMVLNIAEVSTFRDSQPTSDEIREASNNCPHPYLPLLGSAPVTIKLPLERLFCLVRHVPINIVRGAHSGIEESQQRKNDDDNIMLMLPLSNMCMTQLVHDYLWPTTRVIAEDRIVPSSLKLSLPNFAHLLPDHFRNRIESSNADYTMTNKLKHKYILYQDINETTPSTVGDDFKRRSQFYFIQLDNGCSDDPNEKLFKYILSARGMLDCAIINSNRTSIKATFDGKLNDDFSILSDNDGQDNDNEVNKSKKNWDPAILSTICRWRSCLCEASMSSTKYLCDYHDNLRSFIERKQNDKLSSDSAKYLPNKRAPNLNSIKSDVKKDLVMIRAASTLLQELWDGKLKTTMKSFTKKVVSDIGVRKRLEAAITLHGVPEHMSMTVPTHFRSPSNKELLISGASNITTMIPTPPSWSIWRNEAHLIQTKEAMAANETIMTNILSAETLVTEQLNQLAEFKVFPSVELALARKENKAYKEHAEELKHQYDKEYRAPSKGRNLVSLYQFLNATAIVEHKTSEKKLAILTSRRLEEYETKQALLRKIARAKEIQVAQSRDPLNFGNQRNRF